MPELLIDVSFARPNPHNIRAAGYIGVMRYLSGGYPGKDLSRAEAEQYHAAGLGIGLVWETTARRALSGTAAGHDDALRANEEADRLGMPADCPIFYAVDFDATPGQVQAYLAAAHHDSHRPAGAYGSLSITRAARGFGLRYTWQTCAWSRGKVDPGCNLYQRISATRAILGEPKSAWDEDVLINPFPLWLWSAATPAPPPPPPPAPTPAPPPTPHPPTPLATAITDIEHALTTLKTMEA